MNLRSVKGFTLNELLIVIAILAIMAGAAVIALNPGEFLGQARDSKRIAELNSLASAITLHTNSVIGGYKGEENTVYISLPDTVETCNTLLPSLPAVPSGWSYHCVTADNLTKTDGDGWLPVNLNAMPGGSPFEQLPVDPENDASRTLYYSYVYGGTSGGYALTALTESEKQGEKAYEDGGTDLGRFEVGSDLSIWSEASGLVGYWKLNEGTGTSAADNSAEGNNGTLVNGPTWVDGKSGKALNFDGTTKYVEVLDSPDFDVSQKGFTYMAWIKPSAFTQTYNMFMGHYLPYFNVRSSKVLHMSMNANGAQRSVLGATVLDEDTWYFAASTYDENGYMRVYLNGSQDGIAGPFLSPGNYDYNFYIGKWYSGTSYPFSGIVDDVVVYNRALTPSEIMAAYKATK
jgi:prepilin-type N-terminal cleavage/methylation domain-containing protein